MATKKNIQKNDRKESGAGLAAGINVKTTLSRLPEETQTLWVEKMRSWPLWAGEPMQLKIINTCCYAFGTETACRRLLNHFAFLPEWKGISEHGGGRAEEWFFFIEPLRMQKDMDKLRAEITQ